MTGRFVAVCVGALLTGCAVDSALIVDRIDGVQKYQSLNPHFDKAFAFLQRKDLAELKEGRYEIDGSNCWAIVQKANLTPMEDETTVEAHRRYIDIQAPITGDETIGLCSFDTSRTDLVFDEAKDIVFFQAKVGTERGQATFAGGIS